MKKVLKKSQLDRTLHLNQVFLFLGFICCSLVTDNYGFIDGKAYDRGSAGENVTLKCYVFCYALKILKDKVEEHTFTYRILFFLQDGAARPMTAVRAAGYSSSLTRGKCANDKFPYSLSLSFSLFIPGHPMWDIGPSLHVSVLLFKLI